MNWLHFLILCLACWRLTLFIIEDTGPFGVFERLRAYISRKSRTEPIVRKSKAAEGITCSHCVSVYIALPMAAYAYHHSSLPLWLRIAGDIFLLWNALSAAAILIHRVPEKK